MEVDFASVFEDSPTAMMVLSPDLTIRAVNRAYEKSTGLARDALIGRPLPEIPAGPAGRGPADAQASLERVLAEGEVDIVALLRYDLEDPGVRRSNAGSVPGAALERGERPDHGPRRQHRRDHPQGAGDHSLPRPAAQGGGALGRPRLGGGADAADRGGTARPGPGTQRGQQAPPPGPGAGTRDQPRAPAADAPAPRGVADTSHDLKGPISGLQTRLQSALADPDTDLRDMLLAALQDAERLDDIVSELLVLAQLESENTPDLQPVDLAHLVKTELARRRQGITITTRLQPDTAVEGSPVQLARLLENLVGNAERHANTGVEVSVTTDDGCALLEVADDGPGIPAADRRAVFGRFYRRADARRKDPNGTGLGLPIARQIAHSHQGSLHIDDNDPGARLILRLPLRQAPQGEDAQ